MQTYLFYFLMKYKENYLWQESVEKKVYTHLCTYFSDKNWKFEFIYANPKKKITLLFDKWTSVFLYLLVLHCLNCILCGMGGNGYYKSIFLSVSILYLKIFKYFNKNKL